MKKVKKHISTSVWGVLHTNPGQNIQQSWIPSITVVFTSANILGPIVKYKFGALNWALRPRLQITIIVETKDFVLLKYEHQLFQIKHAMKNFVF